jgi:plastocyanin
VIDIMQTSLRRAVILLVVLAAPGCGGSDSPAAPSGPPPVATTTITITSSGANPLNIEVALGSRVRFVNNDSRAHNMASDPHPIHTDCPAINQVGLLLPGQMRETGNLVEVRTCGFHDHDNPTVASLNGSITIK